jgi:hypothetical protein
VPCCRSACPIARAWCMGAHSADASSPSPKLSFLPSFHHSYLPTPSLNVLNC